MLAFPYFLLCRNIPKLLGTNDFVPTLRQPERHAFALRDANVLKWWACITRYQRSSQGAQTRGASLNQDASGNVAFISYTDDILTLYCSLDETIVAAQLHTVCRYRLVSQSSDEVKCKQTTSSQRLLKGASHFARIISIACAICSNEETLFTLLLAPVKGVKQTTFNEGDGQKNPLPDIGKDWMLSSPHYHPH